MRCQNLQKKNGLRAELRNLCSRVMPTKIRTSGGGCGETAFEEAVQLNINFLPMNGKGVALYTEARVLYSGKSVDVAEMSVQDYKSKVIARATGTVVGWGR